jgi:putative membrane-bound dehydrogenase-like protein
MSAIAEDPMNIDRTCAPNGRCRRPGGLLSSTRRRSHSPLEPRDRGATLSESPTRWIERTIAAPSAPAFLVVLLYLLGFLGLGHGIRANEFPSAPDTQEETIPRLSPDAALATLDLPEGFRATLFAHEPEIRQPIGATIDARGRLWVAESYTYAEGRTKFDPAFRDRIVILEDVDSDGRADRRTVFHDDLRYLTSVEIGDGGVWALCPPHLVFIPDQDGDDRPDGDPVIVLDGFDTDRVQHNIANGLRWGPDGWLYGRHGILATSRVGPPGSPPERRASFNCAIWRFHPGTRRVEAVAHGTTNPWGHDWNEYGELFFINTVIGHLWHVVPGAHFERMYGEDLARHRYALMPQVADHLHWDSRREAWHDIRKLGITPKTDELGGGHAHCGMMIYLGDNWPESYRGDVFTLNLHGRRVNRDRLERQGAGFVARHAPDALRVGDPWFRGVELLYGPDGGVFILDWSDIGECHESDGVHRSSGRIYKIVHGDSPRKPAVDLEKLSDGELVRLQLHENEWHARTSRRILAARAARGEDLSPARLELTAIFEKESDVARRLRGLWSLHVTGGAGESLLLDALDDPSENVRAWSVRLLVEEGTPSERASSRLVGLADTESSGLVLLYLVSASRSLDRTARSAIARRVSRREEFASDPALPLLLWYAIEADVVADPMSAIDLATTSLVPVLTRHITRRLAEEIDSAPEPISRLLGYSAEDIAPPLRAAILEGATAALAGRTRATAPTNWPAVASELARSADARVRGATRDLALVFGEGRAISELVDIAAAADGDIDVRRDAIRALAGIRAEPLLPLAKRLVPDRDVGIAAIRALAAWDDPEVPALLLRHYERFLVESRRAAISTLSSRPSWALALLDAVESGVLPRAHLDASMLRTLDLLGDAKVSARLGALLPDYRAVSRDKVESIGRLRVELAPERIESADPSRGREIFDRACASCHVLFGEGRSVGPDLTGAQRSELSYLLENLVDPSATVGDDHRVTVYALRDGRIVNGIVRASSERVIEIDTATERLVIDRALVTTEEKTELSLMPERLLDALTESERRDLVSYLMSPVQVLRPENSSRPTSDASKPGKLRAGAHAIDIAPRRFPVPVNGGFTAHFADGVVDSLHSRSLALDDGKSTIVITVVDSCMLPEELVERAKIRAEKATGVPRTGMLISATHTHSAPAAMGCHGTDPDPEYAALLEERIAEGIAAAVQRLAPARIGFGVAPCPEHVFCRRWIMKPGTAWTEPFTGRTENTAQMNPGAANPNRIRPTGPVDPDVTVLSVVDPTGQPIALLANYSTHYAGAPSLSSDYFGVFCRRVGELLGAEPGRFVGMISNGTSGDANAIDLSRPDVPYDRFIVAESVAKAAIEALRGIEHRDDVEIGSISRALTLGVRRPSAEEVTDAKAFLEEHRPRELPQNVQENYARETVLLSDWPPTRSILLQAIRIGDFAITAIPCEVFGSTGLRLKRDSPFQRTMNVSLANGYAGYIPPPDQHALGGYTTWRARTSFLEVDAEPRIVETMLELLSALRTASDVPDSEAPSLQGPAPTGTPATSEDARGARASAEPPSRVSDPAELLRSFRWTADLDIELVACEP